MLSSKCSKSVSEPCHRLEPHHQFCRQKPKFLKICVFKIWSFRTHTGIFLGLFVGFYCIWGCSVVFGDWICIALHATCDFGPLHCRSPFAAFHSTSNRQKTQTHVVLAWGGGNSPLFWAGAWPGAGLGPHPAIGGCGPLRMPVSVGYWSSQPVNLKLAQLLAIVARRWAN